MTDYEQLENDAGYGAFSISHGEFGSGLGINASNSQLIGKAPTKFSAKVYRVGNPTGDAYAVITDYRDSPPLDNVRATSNSIAVSTFPTSAETADFVEFTFDGTVALQQYDVITMIKNGGTDSSNYPVIRQEYNSQPFETGKCFLVATTAGEWNITHGVNSDACFKLTTGEPVPTGGTRLPPPPIRLTL
jgi:hypothetical protein